MHAMPACSSAINSPPCSPCLRGEMLLVPYKLLVPYNDDGDPACLNLRIVCNNLKKSWSNWSGGTFLLSSRSSCLRMESDSPMPVAKSSRQQKEKSRF